MSDQFVEGKWSGGSKFYWQADTGNAEFILFVGANPYEANYGPPLRGAKMTTGMAEGRLKIAVADPRCSKTASRAWKWLPVRPNGVGALGMGMMRWILENGRYNARYLSNANKAAATEDKEPTWTQAAWLVKLVDGKPGPFLRASDVGLPTTKRKAKDGKEWTFDPFIVSKDGKIAAFDPNDEKNPVEGDLFVRHGDQGDQGEERPPGLSGGGERQDPSTTGPRPPGSRNRTSWKLRRNSRATGRRPSRIFTAASPSSPPASTTSSST